MLERGYGVSKDGGEGGMQRTIKHFGYVRSIKFACMDSYGGGEGRGRGREEGGEEGIPKHKNLSKMIIGNCASSCEHKHMEDHEFWSKGFI